MASVYFDPELSDAERRQRLYEGDIIIMPAGTPHGWLDVPVGVDYLSVRPDPDRVLPDDYTHPALGPDFEMRTPQDN